MWIRWGFSLLPRLLTPALSSDSITSCCLKKSDIFRACWISLSLLRYDFCVETHQVLDTFSRIHSWEAAVGE